MEVFVRMVSEGKLPNKQTINILMELLDEADQFSKVRAGFRACDHARAHG